MVIDRFDYYYYYYFFFLNQVGFILNVVGPFEFVKLCFKIYFKSNATPINYFTSCYWIGFILNVIGSFEFVEVYYKILG